MRKSREEDDGNPDAKAVSQEWGWQLKGKKASVSKGENKAGEMGKGEMMRDFVDYDKNDFTLKVL